MTDTFFDLQRFADPVVLGGTSTGFKWDSGEFVGGGDSTAANVGTATNPAYWAATGGVSAVAGSEVYLTGKDGYSFSIQNKEWSLALADEDILKASKDGNHAFAGTNSTLDVDGTFEENVNGIDQYVSGDINATVGNSGTGTGLLYTFEKDANGVAVALPEGTAAIFGKNSTDITLGVAKDSLSISGLGFKEGITAASNNGEISFVTGSNTITLPAGVLDLKTYDAQVAQSPVPKAQRSPRPQVSAVLRLTKPLGTTSRVPSIRSSLIRSVRQQSTTRAQSPSKVRPAHKSPSKTSTRQAQPSTASKLRRLLPKLKRPTLLSRLRPSKAAAFLQST